MSEDVRFDKKRRYVLMLQGSVNILLPLYAMIHVAQQMPGLGLSKLVGPVLLFSLIVGSLFIAMMQIVAVSEIKDTISTRALAINLVSPFAYLGVVALLSGIHVSWYAFELGALYTTAIFSAFVVILVFRPFFSGQFRTFTPREALNHTMISGLQLIFLVPGLFWAWIFTEVLVARSEQLGETGWRLFLLAPALAHLIWLEYRWMSPASPQLGGTRSRP